MVELKKIAKSLRFSRIKPEAKQHVILETPMEEPAWNLLAENLSEHLRSRFVYSTGKVTVRGLGMLKADQQLERMSEKVRRMAVSHILSLSLNARNAHSLVRLTTTWVLLRHPLSI
jgi:transcription-repair coupling factor (superfamily II helicase)